MDMFINLYTYIHTHNTRIYRIAARTTPHVTVRKLFDTAWFLAQEGSSSHLLHIKKTHAPKYGCFNHFFSWIEAAIYLWCWVTYMHGIYYENPPAEIPWICANKGIWWNYVALTLGQSACFWSALGRVGGAGDARIWEMDGWMGRCFTSKMVSQTN